MKLGKRKAAERGGILLNLIIFVSFVVFCAVLYLVRRPILRFVAESLIGIGVTSEHKQLLSKSVKIKPARAYASFASLQSSKATSLRVSIRSPSVVLILLLIAFLLIKVFLP